MLREGERRHPPLSGGGEGYDEPPADGFRTAVIGGGVFGATAALELARAGVRVDLFERHADLVLGTTRANQGRLHHGYHYPRSPIADMREHAKRFETLFPQSVITNNQHYYCVARERSHVTGGQYIDFCEKIEMPYSHHFPDAVRRDSVDVSVRVPEALIDVDILRETLRQGLLRHRVRTHFGRAVALADLDGYDLVINATYGRMTDRVLRFEVCETALIRLGPALAAQSFVVMDGPFISLDPVPGTDLHKLYHVVHSVHAANLGREPLVPAKLAPLVDQGPVRTPLTNVHLMLGTARDFLRGMDGAEYHGSLFAVRAVLPDVDATDERPTLVDQDGRLVSILSGKIDMAAWAAEQVVAIVRGMSAG